MSSHPICLRLNLSLPELSEHLSLSLLLGGPTEGRLKGRRLKMGFRCEFSLDTSFRSALFQGKFTGKERSRLYHALEIAILRCPGFKI